MFLSRTAEPMGQRRYWPIYEAAAAAGLPVGVHAFGYGGWPITSGGWGSFYLEEMVGHAQAQQALLISMIFEGVFERLAQFEGGADRGRLRLGRRRWRGGWTGNGPSCARRRRI